MINRAHSPYPWLAVNGWRVCCRSTMLSKAAWRLERLMNILTKKGGC